MPQNKSSDFLDPYGGEKNMSIPPILCSTGLDPTFYLGLDPEVTLRASILPLEERTRYPIELWMGRRPLPISMKTKVSRTVHQFGEEEAPVCVAPRINPGPVESSLLVARCSGL